MSVHFFVGGPADGTWRDTDRDDGIWAIAVEPESVETSTELAVVNRAFYEPVDYCWGTQKIVIFRHCDMKLTPLQLLHHLCRGYAK